MYTHIRKGELGRLRANILAPALYRRSVLATIRFGAELFSCARLGADTVFRLYGLALRQIGADTFSAKTCCFKARKF